MELKNKRKQIGKKEEVVKVASEFLEMIKSFSPTKNYKKKKKQYQKIYKKSNSSEFLIYYKVFIILRF